MVWACVGVGGRVCVWGSTDSCWGVQKMALSFPPPPWPPSLPPTPLRARTHTTPRLLLPLQGAPYAYTPFCDNAKVGHRGRGSRMGHVDRSSAQYCSTSACFRWASGVGQPAARDAGAPARPYGAAPTSAEAACGRVGHRRPQQPPARHGTGLNAGWVLLHAVLLLRACACTAGHGRVPLLEGRLLEGPPAGPPLPHLCAVPGGPAALQADGRRYLGGAAGSAVRVVQGGLCVKQPDRQASGRLRLHRNATH